MAKLLTQEQAIERAVKVHGESYDYSLVQYVNSITPIEIICKVHKTSFFSTLDNHTHNKGGCPTCKYIKASKSMSGDLQSFLVKAKRIYGDRFDYSEVVYVSAKTRVKITCREHGVSFMQSPDKHFAGVGCGLCAKNGYNKSKQGSLYILGCDDLIKIGITNRDVALREKAISRSSKMKFEILLDIKFADGAVPMDTERNLLRYLRENYDQPQQVFDGATECFLGLPYRVAEARVVQEIQRALLQ